MDRINDFKRELNELLKKYEAHMLVEEPESYVGSATIQVQFDSIWDGGACVDEYRQVNLGTEIIP